MQRTYPLIFWISFLLRRLPTYIHTNRATAKNWYCHKPLLIIVSPLAVLVRGVESTADVRGQLTMIDHPSEVVQ